MFGLRLRNNEQEGSRYWQHYGRLPVGSIMGISSLAALWAFQSGSIMGVCQSGSTMGGILAALWAFTILAKTSKYGCDNPGHRVNGKAGRIF